MGTLGALWGIVGTLALIGYAVLHLSHHALDGYSHDFRWFHWGVLIVTLNLLLYFKAYRGFQKGLSPRIAARARYLRANPTAIRVVMAPVFCMEFFHTVRRRQISIIAMTLAMVALIFLVRLMGQPWRGIIDTGIAAALTWGFVTILVYGVGALTSSPKSKETQS